MNNKATFAILKCRYRLQKGGEEVLFVLYLIYILYIEQALPATVKYPKNFYLILITEYQLFNGLFRKNIAKKDEKRFKKVCTNKNNRYLCIRNQEIRATKNGLTTC